ncbi:phosphoribosylglycinamide formyltransferase, formyltetrahydrofolate-dependent [Anaerolinea thermolimosa]|uniref:phosphoribosylglycinamide formyltransferase n=1 Tax=Anaerolinea thermolimosa TaxID=229919 RepID=UPI0007818C5A|nr:phosphoribosylglycinamide formyltransferase [Anaerolinea thermolimosa]GAP05973.1 phosphoribosylglycinamide formyltransferase, formyltetrahydrofolate-dependent [Anaerolinea thermolimosa]
MNTRLARLVVLISGNGSNLQAILDACDDGTLPARVVAVISNRAEAYGLERARRAGVEAVYFPKPKEEDRQKYDQRLATRVAIYQPDWVVLAGWMRILSNEFLSRFPMRVINLHPALPGCFPGKNAIERAYAAFREGKITRTGVMVHLVPDEGVDCGPVLGQVEVPLLEGESLENLEARMHEVEHTLLVQTLRNLLLDPELIKGVKKDA